MRVATPKRLYKALSHLEASLLELHDGGVVDAGTLGEDQDRQLVGVLHVVPQSGTGITDESDSNFKNKLNFNKAGI